MIDPGLDGKVAVVTGANHGIGAATAKALAAQGVSVLITYLRREPEYFGVAAAEARSAAETGAALGARLRARPGSGAVDEIRAAGGEAEALEADLTEPANVALVFDRAEETFGPVQILVNNAQDSDYPETTFTLTAATFDKAFHTNTRATSLMIGELARRHRDGGADWGRVVSLSTDSAQQFPTHVSYGASKAAIEAFTRSACHELGPLGITVNAVAPGPVQTGTYTSRTVAAKTQDIPLGTFGEPEDIADVIVFLASEQARWLTGQVLRVSGGHIV